MTVFFVLVKYMHIWYNVNVYIGSGGGVDVLCVMPNVTRLFLSGPVCSDCICAFFCKGG